MLNIVWSAQFKDGTIIHQFDDHNQTQEHRFKEVLDRQEDLSVFTLSNVKTNRLYRLNLETGLVHIISSNSFVHNPEPDLKHKNNVRLIYFRRMQQKVKFDGKKISSNDPVLKAYFLGYQWNDAEGKNHKFLLQIHDDDQMFISSEGT